MSGITPATLTSLSLSQLFPIMQQQQEVESSPDRHGGSDRGDHGRLWPRGGFWSGKSATRQHTPPLYYHLGPMATAVALDPTESSKSWFDLVVSLEARTQITVSSTEAGREASQDGNPPGLSAVISSTLFRNAGSHMRRALEGRKEFREWEARVYGEDEYVDNRASGTSNVADGRSESLRNSWGEEIEDVSGAIKSGDWVRMKAKPAIVCNLLVNPTSTTSLFVTPPTPLACFNNEEGEGYLAVDDFDVDEDTDDVVDVHSPHLDGGELSYMDRWDDDEDSYPWFGLIDSFERSYGISPEYPTDKNAWAKYETLKKIQQDFWSVDKPLRTHPDYRSREALVSTSEKYVAGRMWKVTNADGSLAMSPKGYHDRGKSGHRVKEDATWIEMWAEDIRKRTGHGWVWVPRRLSWEEWLEKCTV